MGFDVPWRWTEHPLAAVLLLLEQPLQDPASVLCAQMHEHQPQHIPKYVFGSRNGQMGQNRGWVHDCAECRSIDRERSTGMFGKAFAVASVLTVIPWTVMAQNVDRSAGAFVQSAETSSVHRKAPRHPSAVQSRNVRLNAGASDLPPISKVGPDNYKYWLQACCS